MEKALNLIVRRRVIVILALIPIGAVAHSVVSGGARPLVDLLLIYSFGLGLGLLGVLFWVRHFFFNDMTAASIGWPPHRQFQAEIAFANLGTGLNGLIAVFVHGHYWIAAVVSASTFLLGAAYVHIRDIRHHKNYAPNNAGIILYYDLLFPLWMTVLLIWKFRFT